MVQPISEELVKRIKKEVQSGKLKWQVAQELGVAYDTVKKYTRGMTLPPRRYKRLPEEIREMIKEAIEEGKSRYQVARELNLPYHRVVEAARDLPVTVEGFPGIRGGTLKALQQLLEKGYTFDLKTPQFHTLSKYFPRIKKTTIGRQRIYYLDDKALDAAKAFLEQKKSRVMSYQELKAITKVFKINMNPEEKKRFIGKKHKEKKTVLRSIKHVSKRSSKRSQTLLDDFLGRFLHSEVLFVSGSEVLTKHATHNEISMATRRV